MFVIINGVYYTCLGFRKIKSAKCLRLMHISHMLGANDFGQLGDGTEERRKLPEKVKQLESEFVKSVSCGAHCSACIAEPRENDGSISTRRLWVWGQNQVIPFKGLIQCS